MPTYYQKPTTGEKLLIFGDGDEAIYDGIGNSSVKDYYHLIFRPTPQMRWKKQIPDSHYNENDRWIHKIYKKDLCFQLSFDPLFPVWIILCDYDGKEDTTMIENFVRCKSYIDRNRQLQQDNSIAIAQLNSLKKILRKKSQHPDESEYEKLAYLERMQKMKALGGQQQQAFGQQQEL